MMTVPPRPAHGLDCRLEEMFETVATTVFRLVEDVSRVSGLTAELTAMVGPEGRAVLMGPVAVIGALLAEVERETAEIFSMMWAIHANAAKLRAVLRDQSADMRMAAMVATYARVVSSTIPQNDGHLMMFAEEMQALLASAAEGIGQVQDMLVSADHQVQHTAPLLRGLNQDAADLIAVGAELPRMMARVPTAELDRASKAIGQDLQGLNRSLQVAVGHLQVGDAARQRLEHAQAIRHLAAGRGGAHRLVLDHLADLQDRAASEALNAAAHVILPELDLMAEHWGGIARSLERFADLGNRSDLAAIITTTSAISTGVQGLERRRAGFEPDLARMIDLYGGVGDQVQRATALNHNIGLLSINAILASRRAGDQGLALMEVSRQLREITTRIDRQSADIARLSSVQEGAIERLQAHGDLGVQADFGQAVASLGALVDGLAAKLAAINAALSGWAGTTPFLTMRRTLREIGTCADAGQMLPDLPPGLDLDDPALGQDLAQIRALYTMRAERDLHDGLFAPGSVAAAPPTEPALAAEDDLESVFF